jgi:hypothetical protein
VNKGKNLCPFHHRHSICFKGKSVVQVTTGLDLTTDQALKIQSDYLVLRNMGLASRILMEHRKDLGAYLGLLNFVNENKIKVKDLNHAVDLTQNIDNMKKEKSQLENDIDTLMDLKKYYEVELNKSKENTTKSDKCITSATFKSA